jgi:molybdopterin converting factor subunit 1
MSSMNDMKITVLFFATLRSLTGLKSQEFDLPPESRVADLKIIVGDRFPQVASALMETVLVSVNREYAQDDQIVPDGAEVALFPPVSGG